jgi:BlaI family penicillinase repressor
MKHIYHPLLEEKNTKGKLINQMVNTLFDGSRSNLVMQLFGNSKPSRQELEEIRELLREMDNKTPKK